MTFFERKVTSYCAEWFDCFLFAFESISGILF